tara:strand:+ start:13638 stop:14483 length:846 start_codon:yes stop_codon:yes gene_type:complete
MKNFRTFSISLSWLWLGFFVLAPTLLLILTSVLSKGDTSLVRVDFTFHNYIENFNWVYVHVFLRSLKMAFIVTVVSLFIAFPFALIIARTPPRLRNFLLMLNVIPFWTNSIITTYAIMIIVKTKGLLNSALLGLGIIHQPLHILYSPLAVYIGLIYNLLPFMILPLYARLEKLDDRVLEAAQDLGANRWQILYRIVIPMSMPGIVAGCLFVFLPAMTLFYVPNILGGAKSYLLGNLIQDQFLTNQNWPFGASLSVALTIFAAALIWLYWYSAKNTNKDELL